MMRTLIGLSKDNVDLSQRKHLLLNQSWALSVFLNFFTNKK